MRVVGPTPQRVLRASIRREIGEFDDRFLIRPEIEDNMASKHALYVPLLRFKMPLV